MNYFDNPDSKHFSFESFAKGLDENAFGVINFKGYEAISETYDFEIMLVSSNKDIDLESVLQSQAVFTIHRGANDDVLYNGILSEFDQLHEVNDVIFYRARLVPKLWWLSLTHHNQVFLKQSVPNFVEDALRDGGLETSGFEIGTLTGYQDIDYVCQYDESHFNFVSRWLERQGIYYYFKQENDGEVLVLTDSRFSHDSLIQGAELFYNPASGLEGKHLGEAIGAFTCRQKQLPAEVILKDYNYERPSLDITSNAVVDPGGRGLSYLYGEFFATQEEGQRLASIRAEELLCQKQEFFGESTVPYIMPGFKFNMNNHYREDFNQEYLILEVTHEGNQSHLMSGGITEDSGQSQSQAIYRNSFKAIPNEVQYRPQRVTEKPKISGTIHAKIDSEIDEEYAQIDDQGRYRVRLPFDINDDHMDGKGSAPIRMMQAYAGKNRGMQFPLVKGTEVLLTFIEGNPDRPIIAGAVSNPETQGPVNANNQSESVIQTGGNNKIRMEDKAGSERMVFESPASNSWIRVGAKNDPPILNGSSGRYLEAGASWSDPGAKVKNSITGAYTDIFAAPADITLNGTQTVWNSTNAQIGTWIFTYRATNTLGIEETAQRTVTVYDNTATTVDGANDDLSDDSDGIRIRTAGNLWLESQSRYAEYIQGTPSTDSLPRKLASATSDPNELGDIRDNFGDGYCPTGMINYITKAAQNSFQKDVLANAHVKLSSFDTVTTQEGNIYDFGGCWNYNLGNGYAEDHMDQSAVLNKKAKYDLLDAGGPHFTKINWPDNCKLDGFSTGSLWVEKKFGNSYDYLEGSAISVTKGDTLDVSRGGRHIEVSINKVDKITKWSTSGGGLAAEEKKWNPAGALLSHSISKFDGIAGVTGMEFSFSAKATHEYSFGASTKFSISADATSSLSLSAGASLDISASASAKMSIAANASASLDIEFCAAGKIAIENLDIKTNLPGLRTRFGLLDMDGKTNKMITAANNIKAIATAVDTKGVSVNSAGPYMMSNLITLMA